MLVGLYVFLSVLAVWLMFMYWSFWVVTRITQQVDRITGVVRRDGHPAAARKVESASPVADVRKRIPID